MIENLGSIFLLCAVLGTVVFVLKIALPVDSGTEVSVDFNSMADTDASFSLFTIEGVSAFFMMSGWLGWFSYAKMNYPPKISALIAFIAGFIGMFFFAFLISKFKKLEHVPKFDLKTLEGKSGKAYMDILCIPCNS